MTSHASSGRTAQWEQQRHFYEEECDPEFEITRPHGCGRLYEFLIDYKFQSGLNLLGLDLYQRTLLEVCCGSGMMSEKFAELGAIVTGTDFSPTAVARARERARRFRFAADFQVADAENLNFPDRSFDLVAVHDGLHHLEDPERALREMARVARLGVVIMDPADAAITRLAVWLGIAEDVEDAGNEVRRLRPRRVAECLRSEGFAQIAFRRTLMYYPHRPYRWFGWFDSPPLFALFRAGFRASNLLLGRFGNKLSLSARRTVEL
jgi:SAM-dependent methyltransferase